VVSTKPDQRKGARRIAEIPPETLLAISRGQIATVNLVEFLAADLALLLPAVADGIGLDPAHPSLIKTIAALPEIMPMKRHWVIAECLSGMIGPRIEIERKLASHVSDLARQWAAMMVGLRAGTSLAERLDQIRPFAADVHFGVREIAWMAVRDAVAGDVEHSIALLTPWAGESDPNLRRFASEVTRPRGVWCAHIEQLKMHPELAFHLLEMLRDDASRYVQNSVGNWLNDAAKSNPAWVQETCRRWMAGAPAKTTQYICKRGMRSLPA